MNFAEDGVLGDGEKSRPLFGSLINEGERHGTLPDRDGAIRAA